MPATPPASSVRPKPHIDPEGKARGYAASPAGEAHGVTCLRLPGCRRPGAGRPGPADLGPADAERPGNLRGALASLTARRGGSELVLLHHGRPAAVASLNLCGEDRVLVRVAGQDQHPGGAGLPDQGRQRRADRNRDPRRPDPSRPRRPGTPRGRGHQPAAARGPGRLRPRTARWAHRPRGRGDRPPRVGAEQH